MRVTAKAGPDGFFHLDVPLDSSDQLYDVAVVISERPPIGRKPSAEELGWPPGYFETTAGALPEFSVEPRDQGEFERGEDL
jgi:hypothetical protein